MREAWARIGSSSAFDPTVEKVDLAIESAPENMDLKQKLFARLDAVAERSAVLASNTSGLSITAIASRCRHPERVLTTHFWNPPHLMPLVEIVQGEKTSPEGRTSLCRFAETASSIRSARSPDRPAPAPS